MQVDVYFGRIRCDGEKYLITLLKIIRFLTIDFSYDITVRYIQQNVKGN